MDIPLLVARTAEYANDPDHPLAEALTHFTEELAGQWREAAETLLTPDAKGSLRSGAKGRAKLLTDAATELDGVADALSTYAAKAYRDAEPPYDEECPAMNNLGGQCVRRDRHEAHTYRPVDPLARVPATAVQVPQEAALGDGPACGATDPYSTHGDAHAEPDVCTLPAGHIGIPGVGGNAHEGSWSKWPEPGTPAGDLLETVRAGKSPDPATIAYLRGETDDLGTPPLFNAGDDPADLRENITPVNPEVFMTGATSEPDPFADAMPPERVAGWHTPVPARPAPWAVPLSEPHFRGIHQSAVKTGEDCGLQLRLIDRDGVPQVPTWANVGGSGVHYAIQYIEQEFIRSGTIDCQTPYAAAAAFSTGFDHAMADADQESGGMPRSWWRTSGKGAEGEDWWHESGPHMVRDYAAWSAQRHADGWQIVQVPIRGLSPGNVDYASVLEYDFNFMLDGVQLEGTIDQLWWHPEHGFELLDPKSGAKPPEDDFQLAFYARALPFIMGWPAIPSRVKVRAAYYDARNAHTTDLIDPFAVMSDAEIVYRASAIAGMHAAGVYPANPKGFGFKSPCVICPVSYACPIMALKRPGLEP